MLPFIIGGGVLGVLALALVIAMALRRVVETNMVHIVQSGRKTTSYGKDRPAGNVYYEIPASVPVFGVTVTEFPESVFNVSLKDYEAYDTGRLPFLVDVTAFFRIANSDMAAHRVSNFEELHAQLHAVLQGAVRRVLAIHKLEEIMEARGDLGTAFTKEVDGQLTEWGVKTVKNIEFMDLRDSGASQVIRNIMAKEQSRIDMESRTTVAANTQAAQQREIDAQREVALQQQQAAQAVGERTAQQQQAVGIAEEKAKQEVLAEAKLTAERNMEVKQVQDVRAAEINRSVALVEAERDKGVQIVDAEGEKQRTEIVAQGNLTAATLHAQGVEVEGRAQGAAKEAVLMAEVTPQMALAKEIGANDGYQGYLVRIEQVKAGQVVGVAQADALKAADIKVIVNGGDVPSGMNNITDIFTSKGGQAVGAMLEGLAQTETGRAVVEKVTKPKPNGSAAHA